MRLMLARAKGDPESTGDTLKWDIRISPQRCLASVLHPKLGALSALTGNNLLTGRSEPLSKE